MTNTRQTTLYTLVIATLIFLPIMTFAADLEGLLGWLIRFLQTLIPIIIGFEVLLFIIGVIRYVMGADNEAERRRGNLFIVYALLSIFVTVAIWGLIIFLGNTLQIGAGGSVRAPQLSEKATDFQFKR